MEYLYNAEQMKYCDEYTISQVGIPSAVLMERAALAVVEEIDKAHLDLSRVLVVCGSGNNGGDGFAAARLLNERKAASQDSVGEIVLAFVGKESSLTKETAMQKQICENLGIKSSSDFMEGDYTLIIDAMLGIGLSRKVEGFYADVIRWINARKKAKVAAVDIPSGVSADDGKILGTAVRADLTVTFAERKTGQILYPGASCCGKLVCRKIGISSEFSEMKKIFTYGKEDLQRLPKRSPYSNKGTYGKVLLIAGSEGMSGAAVLSARAAYRTGCGMVRVFTPACNRIVIQTALPEAILTCFEPQEEITPQLLPSLAWADRVGIGPGLGTSAYAEGLLKAVLEHCEKPMVVDADGLNLLAAHPYLWEKVKKGTILTPHIGEMMRLTGMTKEQLMDALLPTAQAFARHHQIVLVLKDARTIVTDGEQVYVNTSGTDAMATAGSGDVLTGVICGLLAQGLQPFDAAALGVYVHGLAGELAKDALGARAVMAGDIAEQIGNVREGEQ